MGKDAGPPSAFITYGLLSMKKIVILFLSSLVNVSIIDVAKRRGGLFADMYALAIAAFDFVTCELPLYSLT